MHKIKSQTATKIFQNKFHKLTHKYPTNFSTSNYSIPPFKLSKSKYRISIRSSILWKSIPTNSEKMHGSITVFKNYMRKKLLELENEILHFQVKLLKKRKTSSSWNSRCLLGRVCGGVSFLPIVGQTGSGLSHFPSTADFFLWSSGIFVWLYLKVPM